MIKCLAIDDEPLALDLLQDNIHRVPFLQLVKTCRDTVEAKEILAKQVIDLLFLDVELPGVTGIQFVQNMKSPPLVIFVTGHRQFAVDGFNVDAVDYLLKPVAFDRFLKASSKAYEIIHQKPVAAPVPPAKFLFVNVGYNLVKINFDDILYVEGFKDYVKIFLSSSLAKPVVTRMSMKSIEERLPASLFSRVHKSFIVAVDKMTSIRRGKIQILSVHIPISNRYRSNFYRFIGFEPVASN